MAKQSLVFILKSNSVGSNSGRWFIDYYSPGGIFFGAWDYISNAGKLSNDFTNIFDDGIANTLAFNSQDISDITKIRDCNFNLILSQTENQSDKQNDYYLAMLDYVSSSNPIPGLNVMLSNSEISQHNAINTAYAQSFTDHYRIDLASYPNMQNRIYAISLGDEPYPDGYTDGTGKKHEHEMSYLEAWADFFADPITGNWKEKPTFTNLLPRYGFVSDAEYESYLDDYKTRYDHSPFVSFDHYPFRTSTFFTDYFYNLSIIKSKFPSRKLFAVVHTCSEPGIPDETEAQRYFMVFCPIAYGARGITYFPYDAKGNTAFTNTPSTDLAKYNSIKKINLYIKNIVAPVVMSRINTATLHKKNTSLNWPNYPNIILSTDYPFTTNELLTTTNNWLVNSVSDDNILLGIFEDGISGQSQPDIWIVNKNTNASTSAPLTLKIKGVYSAQISPSSVNYNGNLTYTTLTSSVSAGITTLTLPSLDKGEGRMIKLYQSLPFSSYANNLIASQSKFRIINLYNIEGGLMQKINSEYSINELQTTFNLKNGIYFITILDGNKMISKKISIRK